MPNLQLFRKEALKNRYTSNEFGESVIEQARILDQLLILLLIGLFFFAALVIYHPINSSISHLSEIEKSNFYPLVFPNTVILEKHLLANGMVINNNQAAAKIRFFQPKTRAETSKLLQTHQAGFYFGTGIEGSKVEAYQPIGKVLLANNKDLYFFNLTASQGSGLTSGQKVTIQTGNLSASGTVDSISGPFHKNSYRIGIQIQAPYDKNLLNPLALVEIKLTSKANNILDLLGFDVE